LINNDRHDEKKFMYEEQRQIIKLKKSIMTTHLFRDFRKSYLFLFLIAAVIFLNDYDLCAKHNYKDRIVGYIPKEGFVPNKLTAIRIAISVWLPIYGEKIYNEKPFDAKLENGIWTVEGSLPKNSLGGVALIKIQKTDGKILLVIHGK
jgi:hypothetical protein